jgi:outer membrane protein, multidrug efflux system
MISVYSRYSFLLLFLLTGCMVGPDYEKPNMDLPNVWHNKLERENATREELQWWENFDDPILVTLIEMGIQNNLDLKMAESKILQSRAALKLAKANLLPVFSATAASTHDAVSKDSMLFGGSGKVKRYYELYSGELDASWEIDLFGRLRRAKESSAASLEASIADADGVFLTMVAEIAQNYIILRSNQQQLIIAEKIYEDWDRLYKLHKDLFNAGLGNDIVVVQTKSSRDQALGQLLPLKANIKSAIHRLSILMGHAPNLLYPLLEKPAPIPKIPASVFIGLPSKIIERRPDVREAERKLASATSQIGVAKGDLFPKFNLTGDIGYSSFKGSNLLEPSSLYFTVGPSVSFSIFDFGRIRANIENAEKVRDQAMITYKKTILSALEDVENSLVNYSTEEKRLASLKEASTANRQAVILRHARHKTGLNAFTDVLQDQITYLNSHNTMLQSQATLSQNSIALYKALGGGWQKHEPKEKLLPNDEIKPPTP